MRPLLLRSCSVGVGAATDGGVRRGRVATLLTHDGMASLWLWSRARYCEGVSPMISVNRELNEPSDVQPTAKHVSVTDIPRRSSALARSMRRVIRYEYGVSPYAARNLREKCAGDISAARASAATSSGRAYSRSIRSRARRTCARLASSSDVTRASVATCAVIPSG